jgi:hypothetical protein
MRVAVILAGVVLGLGSLVVAGLYVLIIGLGCSGTDAGEPPSPDSIGHALCDSPALPVGLIVLAIGAVAAPFWGAVIAARRGRYAPLLGSAAVAAGAVSGLALITHAVEEGTENVALIVGVPVLVWVGLVLTAVRQSRAEQGH